MIRRKLTLTDTPVSKIYAKMERTIISSSMYGVNRNFSYLCKIVEVTLDHTDTQYEIALPFSVKKGDCINLVLLKVSNEYRNGDEDYGDLFIVGAFLDPDEADIYLNEYIEHHAKTKKLLNFPSNNYHSTIIEDSYIEVFQIR